MVLLMTQETPQAKLIAALEEEHIGRAEEENGELVVYAATEEEKRKITVVMWRIGVHTTIQVS